MNLTAQVKPSRRSRSLVRVRLKHHLPKGNAAALIAPIVVIIKVHARHSIAHFGIWMEIDLPLLASLLEIQSIF